MNRPAGHVPIRWLVYAALACALGLGAWRYGPALAERWGTEDDPVLWSDRASEWEVNGTKARDVTQFKSGIVQWHELPAGEWRQDFWPSLKKLKDTETH